MNANKNDKFFNAKKAAENGRFEYALFLISQVLDGNRLSQQDREEAARLVAEWQLAEILSVPEWHCN